MTKPCKKCGVMIRNYTKLNGINYHTQNRTYCLACSPPHERKMRWHPKSSLSPDGKYRLCRTCNKNLPVENFGKHTYKKHTILIVIHVKI